MSREMGIGPEDKLQRKEMKGGFTLYRPFHLKLGY